MHPAVRKNPHAVNSQGAKEGAVLRGCARNNSGLRVQVLQDQARGRDGPLEGGFVILDAGDNMHAEALRPLLGRRTDAQEVLAAIRRHHAGCVSVVNANILAAE